MLPMERVILDQSSQKIHKNKKKKKIAVFVS